MHQALHLRDNIDSLYVARKREEEDLPALKTALTHRYNVLKTTEENTKVDGLHPSESVLATQWTTERKLLGNKNGKKKQLHGRFSD